MRHKCLTVSSSLSVLLHVLLHPGKCDYDSITFRMTSRYLMGVPVAGGSVLPNGGAGTGTPVPWQSAVPKMLSWVEDALIFWSKPGAGSPAVQYGARCVSEQRDDANRKQLLTAHCSTLPTATCLPACLPACLPGWFAPFEESLV